MNSKSWAVVLGCDVNGLGVIRSLGEKNIPIIALDHNPYAIGFHSKFVSENLVCPHPVDSKYDLAELLMDIGKRFNGSKVIFPTKDSYVAAIARSRDKLELYYKIPFSRWNVVEYLVDKEKQYKKAAEHGISLPETFYPENEQDIDVLLKSIEFPLILKPAYSEAFYVRYGIKAVKCNSENDLKEQFARYTADGFRMIVQEFIEGDASHLYEFQSYVNSRGNVTAIFIAEKIKQYPTEIGTGTHFISVKEPRLIEVGVQILEMFDYQGISFIEFKLDLRDGRYKLIEINPRTTHCNSLASACGVNIPYAAYRNALGECEERDMESYTVGREWLWPENGFLERRCFTLYIKNMFSRKNCTYAIFSLRDPLPEVSYFCGALRQYINGFFEKINGPG